MKRKWISGLVIILAVFIAGIYMFFPEKVKLSNAVGVKANREGVFRYLARQSNWSQWWPGKKADFKVHQYLYNAFVISIYTGSDTSNSLLTLIPISKDSLQIQWDASIATGQNPFTRMKGYFRAQAINTTCDSILQAMKTTIADVKTIYGLDVKKEIIPYEYVLSKKKVFTSYPSTQEVYALVNELRIYITDKGGKEQGVPLLHVETADSIHYETQVAVPIMDKLPDSPDISSKWMMKDGKIFTAEVTGGVHTVENGFKQIEKYISDRELTPVAIPFQALITDRMKEPDSTKWITKLYFPVVIY